MIAPDVFAGFRPAKGATHCAGSAHLNVFYMILHECRYPDKEQLEVPWIRTREIMPVFSASGGTAPRMSLATPASARESCNLARRTLFIPFTELLGAPSFKFNLPAEDGRIVASQPAASRMPSFIPQCQFVAKQPPQSKLRLRSQAATLLALHPLRVCAIIC